VSILRNVELRTALVALRQTRAALDATNSEQSILSSFSFATNSLPDLFKMTENFYDISSEVVIGNECDLTEVCANQRQC
jgi:hypothetical protein